MTVQTAREKGGVFYFFPLHPGDFALGVYSVIMSILVANFLWICTFLLCISMDHLNFAHTVNRLLEIQVTFATITTYLWWSIYNEKGRNEVTHLLFYIWFGAKITAGMLEIILFPQFYLKIYLHFTPSDIQIVIFNMSCGAVVIMIIEFLGLFFAYKHFKDQRARNRVRRVGKAYIDKTFSA